MTEIKLYKSKKKALKLFLLSATFIVIGVWMITSIESNKTQLIMEWVTFCFFGLGITIALFHLIDKKPQVILNETGIFDRTTHNEFINWDIINDAYPINIFGQHFICLLVPENFKPSKKKNKFYRGLSKLNETIGAQELNIQLGQLDIDTIKLTKFILEMTQADKNKRIELLKNMAPYYY